MAQAYILLLALVVRCINAEKPHVHGFRTEIEALRFLFSDDWRKYDAPYDDNGTAKVKHMLSLNRIVSLDLEKQVLTLDAWVTVQYRDQDLSWDPAMFINLTTIHVPSDRIWRPDILLYNNAGKSDGSTADVLALLTYDGTVIHIQPMQIQSYCKTPRTVPRGDTVECNLKFGSWTYDGLKLDLGFLYEDRKADTSNFDADFNRDWDLTATSATRNVKTYECCPQPYVDLEYTLKLTRKLN